MNIATVAIKPYPDVRAKFKSGRPGYKWYVAFMQRNRRHVRAKFARDVDATRENWATYENFSGWYDFLASDLVDIGLAEPNPEWVGRDPPASATARQRQRIIVKDPSRFIFMDESAVKLDMCDDRERGAKAKVVGTASGEVRRRVGKSSERITIAPAFLGDGRNLPLTVVWKSTACGSLISPTTMQGPIVEDPSQFFCDDQDRLPSGASPTSRALQSFCSV